MSEKEINEAIRKELEAIKKLMIAELVKEGIATDVIGDIIGIDGSTVRKMIPVKKIRKGKE
jgi:hypothetical protein